MTTFDYSELRADAAAAIKDAGRLVTIKTASTTGPSWNPTQTSAAASVYAAFVSFEAGEIDGTTVQVGDMRALIGADVVPTIKAGDVVTDGGVDWTVCPGSVSLQPGSVCVLHDLQLRR